MKTAVDQSNTQAGNLRKEWMVKEKISNIKDKMKEL